MVRVARPSRSRFRSAVARALAVAAAATLWISLGPGHHEVFAAPPEKVPGEVLVKFKVTASASDIRSVMDELGATRLRRFGRIRAEHHRITRLSVDDAILRFRGHRAVEIIEPNWILQADDVPNDLQFHLLWGLRNTGQTGGLAGADIDAVPGWDVQTGSQDVVVAVIDTGTDYGHPDLAANIWTNHGEIPGNLIDDDGNGWIDDVHGYDYHDFDGDPMDDNGHGTHVAGTIGAVGNNALGTTGVAWNVRIMPLKFLGPGGSGSTSSAVLCIEYAIQMGAHVMNNSWGGGGFSSLLQLAIENANAAGIPFVAAAGNSGVSTDQFPHYPASYPVPNVIAVASTTHQDFLSSFSNFGATTVHLAAPGSSIWSTLPSGAYGYLSGTSMATPHVSGALALLRAEFPDMAAAQLRTALLSSVDPLPSLAGLVTTGGRLNVVRMLAGLDSIPPAPITNLTTHDPESDRIVLRWTATGDDGSQGRATRYDVRYSVAPIDEATFGSAHAVASVPAPRPAGAAEEVTVAGLQFETSYYFAVKAIDEYGNASTLSNLAGGRTVGPPDIAVTPLSVEHSLLTGQQGERVIVVTNTAEEGTLEFAAASASPAPSATAQPFLVLGKGEPDPRVGDPVPDGRGGPDRFGYNWTDSDENGGPQFQWVDISAVGTPIGITGDDVTSPFVPIGFLFPFYDNLYAYVRVSTNGFLSFSSGSSDYTNQLLPNPSAPENLVAPFWDDLFFSPSSSAHAWSDGQRFIVQWTNVDHFGGGGPYTFQVILHVDGTIVYQYLFIGAPSASATVGIQNAARDDGLTVVFNNAYVRSGLAVRFLAAPSWLAVTPSTARLAPGQSIPLHVRFDAARLPGGAYNAVVRLDSNDPDEPLTEIGAHLTVGAAPEIDFGSPSLSFLDVFLGGSEAQAILVSNEGVLPLEVTDVRANPSVFEVEDAPFTLNPGESREIEIRFRPASVGTVTGTLTVLSNDPDETVAVLPLSGTGILPPDVSVTPTSLSASVFTGETAARELSIANTGATVLSWRAFPQGVSGASLETFPLLPPSPQGSAPDGPMSARDPALARTDSLTVSLVRLTGVRVLYDDAHGNPSLAAWSRLVQSLTQRGATVNATSAPITPEILAEHEILWITDSSVDWQPSEVEAVTAWLLGGGAMLLEGDNLHSVTVYNALLSAAGVAFRYRDQPGSSGITDHVYPHATTRDVHRVNLDANIATLSGIAPPSMLLLEDVAETPSGAAVTVGTGRILAFADELFSDFHSSFADNQLLANQAFDWLSGISWLQVSPAQGVTPAGGSSTVTVTLDGAGLAGGDHTAHVIVASNDPDEAETEIPVTLRVTGAPDIALSRHTAAFGPVFVTGSGADTIRVTNAGTAALSVEAIEIGDPDFRVEPAGFELGVGQSRHLVFTFAPNRLGPVETTAVLRCNDPDEGIVTISLSGEGREPPDVALSPGSFGEALRTGETVTRTLRIENASGSDLVFRVAIEDAEGSEAPPPGGEGAPEPATTRSWSEFRAGAEEPPGPIAGAPAMPPVTLPVVLRDPGGDGGPVDLTELRASSHGGQLQVEMRLGTPLQAANFGGFLSLDVDQDRATGRLPSFGIPGQDIGMEYEIELFTVPFGVVTLHDRVRGTFVANIPVVAGPSSIRFAVPLASLGNDDGRIDVTGVIGTATGPTDWFPDAGHGMIGGPVWLAAEPASAVVPAGSGVDVAIRFDASALDGGVYDARILVESNDPDEPRTVVPAQLSVTAAPVFAVQPPSLDFGTIFLGTRRDTILTVFNVGSAPLSVDRITVDDPSYTVDAQGFPVEPLESRVLHVRFEPGVAGAHEATLEISHDAAGSPGTVTLTGSAVPPPILTAAPRSFAFTLESGEGETQILALGNAGGSNLVYDIGALATESSVQVRESMEIPRGIVDPRQGDPVVDGSGGPDAFGYRWSDSDEPDGPVFDWVEISQVGTRLPMRTLDDNYGPVPIGFSFPFYGHPFASFQICTHGWISFTNRQVHYTNQPLPSFGAPENLIAAFWEDLDFSNVERAYVHNDGTRLIVQWNNVPRTAGGGPYTFQILLYPNGTILCQYLTMGAPVNGSTVGIQNASRNDGLQVAFNASYLHDRMAIRFSPVPSYLRAEPPFGTLPPGAGQDVRLTGSARGIFPGDYPARLRLTSNDPAAPEITIPVSFHVTGTPDLVASPAALAFDTLYVGRPATRELRITNAGTSRLEVTGVQASRGGISVSPATLGLPPLHSSVLRVTFLATEPGDLGASLAIASNDPDSPAIVPITGLALMPPRVVVEPLPIVAAALPGGRSAKTIRIRNTGASDLRWSAGPPIAAFQPSVNHIDLEKGVADLRPGILGSGGPDRFGHHWVDSDHPGGPAYEWTDISGTGVPVPFSPEADDENRGPFPIGFQFPFYDQSFTQFRICTNGWLSFTSSSTSYTNQPLPSAIAGSPENMIAPLWKDLVVSGSGAAVYYRSEPGRLIVQWSNLRPYGVSTEERYTFQAVLFPSGEIALRYRSLVSIAPEGTTGIQNARRGDGLTVAFNAPYLREELAVRVFERPDWLSLAPLSGVVPAGGSADVILTVDAARLEAGEHRASLPFASNDPDLPVLAAEVLARVGSVDAAAADVDPNTLNLESGGQWIVGRVELPAPCDPVQVVASTVRLNAIVPVADGTVPRIGDFNQNGVPDVELRFDRAAVEAILPEGDPVPVTMTGEVHEVTYFTARDEIRVIRPRMIAPNGGELVPAGSVLTVRWNDPQGSRAERADLVVSLDAGETWRLLAGAVSGNSYAWTVPHTPTTRAWIRVIVYDARGAMGYDTIDGAFTIQPTVSAVETEAGAPPTEYALHQNAPNPFNPVTWIRFDLPRPGRVVLRVHAVDGRLVREWREALPAGRHRVRWDGTTGQGTGVASGVYFARLTVEGERPFEASRRMMVVK